MRSFVCLARSASNMLSRQTRDRHLQIDYALYDGDTASAESLLVSNARPDCRRITAAALSATADAALARPDLTVRYAGTPAFEQAVRSQEPLMIAAFGPLDRRHCCLH